MLKKRMRGRKKIKETISKINDKNNMGYCARPIDFDKLFEVGELRNGFVLSLSQRKKAISKIGWERYKLLINLEQEVY